MYKRKLNKRTNYKKRLSYLVSRKPRLVIRKSNTKLSAQIVEYAPNGDKTLVSTTSKHLINFGYKGKLKNTPSAYLTGILIAKKAQEKSIREVVPDIGFYAPLKGSIVFALIKGAKDGGLQIHLGEEIAPDEKRIQGSHIELFIKEHHKNQDVEPLSKNIAEVKNKLLGK